MSFLDVDLTETLTAFARYKDVSWSKYSEFLKCQGNWFSRNFARFIDVEATHWESTRSIPGTIVQRLFESFINDRIYQRSDMTTMQALVDWFHTNTKALFKLIAFDQQDQYTMERARYYFRRKEGKQRINEMRQQFNLDLVLYKGIQPAFLDWTFFNTEEGSEEIFIKKLNKLYLPILQEWLKMGIDLNKMLSEVWVKAPIFQDINIMGKVDFIYNKFQNSQTPFKDIKQLENAFILIDGKFNISKWVQKEQLFFYSAALYFKHKKAPTHCILFNWSKSEMKTYKFDLKYIDKLKKNIILMIETSNRINIFLKDQRDQKVNKINITDIPGLTFTAGQKSCTFCPIKKNCPAAIEKGLDKDTFLHGIMAKRQTAALLKEQGVGDPSSKIHEIKI